MVTRKRAAHRNKPKVRRPPKRGPEQTGLSPKQLQFIAEYLVDRNGKQAAIRAGYSPHTAEVQGSRLLSLAKVKAAVAAGTKVQLERADLNAARVLEEIRRVAFFDVGALFDERGNLLPLHELNAEARTVIASFEVILKNATAGDGKIDRVLKVKFWDKVKALDLLARHFALLTDVVRVDDDAQRLKQLDEGRLRNAHGH